jgi:hypothetical protein
MKKSILLIISFFIALQISAQTERATSMYLSFHGNQTIYDRVNTGGGAGVGIEFMLNTKGKIKPKMEFDYDIFSGTDLLKLNNEGQVIFQKRNVPCVFIGVLYNPINRVNLSLNLGTSFFNSKTYFAVKPSIGIYFDKKQRFEGKVSLTNIFQRDDAGKEPFGYLNFGIGIKLF